MEFHIRSRKLVCIIALCAVAFALLAPAAIQVLPKSSGLPLLEFCTSAGIKRISLQQAPTETPGHSPEQQHCPFCRLQHDLPVLFASALLIHPDPGPTFQTWLDLIDEPRVRQRWTVGHSRAPPAIS